MSMPYFYKNKNSKFISIEGEDSSEFLQNLITNDIYKCKNNGVIYACLLTPQGKFICDFFIFKKDNKFILETHELFFKNLLKKLKIYKLRSDININEIKNYFSYVVFGNFNKDDQTVIFTTDPRKENIGYKLIQNEKNPQQLKNFEEIEENKYHEILIKNTIPLSHYDLEMNKSLLLENNFENLNSISWDKGCYIGQEITARMKYRALLKKRIYSLKIESGTPSTFQTIEEKENELGKIISFKNKSILAMMKIDDAEKKIQSNEPIKTNDGLILNFIT